MPQPHLIVVLGSPRREGNSATLARRAIAGAEAAGAKVTTFFLHEMDIEPCAACDACRESTSAACIIEDEMHLIYPELRRADALLIAGPVYWFTMSAQTKLFLDRCYALGGPEGHVLGQKRVGMVLTYGDDNAFNSGAVNALRAFQDSFNYVGAEIVGMVHGSAGAAGEVRENAELMDAAYALGEKLVSLGQA